MCRGYDQVSRKPNVTCKKKKHPTLNHMYQNKLCISSAGHKMLGQYTKTILYANFQLEIKIKKKLPLK